MPSIFFTPHPIKPCTSPAFFRIPRFAEQGRGEAKRVEQGCRSASKYLPRTFNKVRGLPQRKPRVLTRGAGFTFL